MYLDDDSVMKTIEIDSIFTEVMVKKKKKKKSFQRCPPCAQITSKFALSEQTFVEWVESTIQPK